MVCAKVAIVGAHVQRRRRRVRRERAIVVRDGALRGLARAELQTRRVSQILVVVVVAVVLRVWRTSFEVFVRLPLLPRATER